MQMKRTFFLIFLLVAVLLSSCSTGRASVSQNVGVGRESAPIDAPDHTPTTDPSNSNSSVTPAPTDDGTQSQTQKLWKKENGRYVYSFPERISADMSDTSDLDSLRYVPFEDAGSDNNDWYIGQTVRDSATGEVTKVWDRADSTLAILEKTNTVYRGNEDEKVVYLTFDCGYETGTTSTILDTLKEKNVPATFFVNGHYVESAQEMVRRMLDEGHIVANHCVNHPDLTTVDADVFVSEVQGLEDIYYTLFPDADPMIYFRPPSGAANEWVLSMADRMGYTTVMWSWAYRDFIDDDQPTAAEAMEKIKRGLHNGCVYLLHPESTTNTAILGDVIDWLRGEGYEILPLCDIVT